ncbi:YciI family protein [Ideonella sp.]|uniref:YciI family protein n=1 Tax=Ideonella sp. TaxID=1929293 RepID=UPI003BB4CED9
MRALASTAFALCAALHAATCLAQPAPDLAKPRFDAALAQSTGADERGMRGYILVVLKTGPNRVAAGPERDEMFKGHFANMKRLSAEGKLVLAGPFDGADGWRGLFIFASTNVDEVQRLVATDPVIAKGEMVAELHPYSGTAALMLVRDLHETIAKMPM